MQRLALVGAIFAATFLAAAAMSASSMGNETINYIYDARGRLTNVTHAGSVNDNLEARYTYDKADSRATVNVTGSPH